MKVPFLDLKAQYRAIKDEVDPAIQSVIEKTAFAGGPFVETFEQAFAEWCGTDHAIGVNSGTTALWAALSGLGIGPGDEVITVPNTFVATVEAIIFCGATPVLADVDEATLTLDPHQVERAITPQTRAIVPVHLYGQMADMDPILEIARKNNLYVVEDAAQAHGATYKGRPAGSVGDAGCFSFYPGKNLGAYGEGGAVTTNDQALAAQIRMAREHGQSRKYYHDILGWNARMDGIQAAVLSVKLRHIEAWNAARAAHARAYNERLSGIEGIHLPIQADYAGHVYHLYVIHLRERDALMKHLAQAGIACGIHYPVNVHLQEAYKGLGYQAGDFPVSERNGAEALSLPMFAELTDKQIDMVCDAIREFASEQARMTPAQKS